MKYLCLVYHEEKVLSTLPKSEYDVLVDESLDLREELGKNGHLIAAEALEPVESATSVRLRKGKVSITDGPFAETKEQLGGFFLINAKDLNEAIHMASKIPGARIGTVEIRPLRGLTHSRKLQ
jgi:hypothetical protein